MPPSRPVKRNNGIVESEKAPSSSGLRHLWARGGPETQAMETQAMETQAMEASKLFAFHGTF